MSALAVLVGAGGSRGSEKNTQAEPWLRFQFQTLSEASELFFRVSLEGVTSCGALSLRAGTAESSILPFLCPLGQ